MPISSELKRERIANLWSFRSTHGDFVLEKKCRAHRGKGRKRNQSRKLEKRDREGTRKRGKEKNEGGREGETEGEGRMARREGLSNSYASNLTCVSFFSYTKDILGFLKS